MKIKTLFFAVLMVCILPCIIVSILPKSDDGISESIEITEHPMKENLSIRVVKNGKVVRMSLDEYVLGVLMGEMPEDFAEETLKAQAVATRTYTIFRVLNARKHSEADVCTEPSCCQAYVDPQLILDTSDGKEKLCNFSRCVDVTSNQVLMYNGAVIEATYFSSSGGRTEDALAVWGTDIPYLRSVASPNEKMSGYSHRTYVFSVEEFLLCLGLDNSLRLYDDSVDITYTTGGGVENIQIGDAIYSGVQIRSLFSLPSTVFSISFNGDMVQIDTRGHGHRVGLSQYGAEAMAASGSDYREILAHYYSGTELVSLTDKQIQAIFDKVENL